MAKTPSTYIHSTTSLYSSVFIASGLGLRFVLKVKHIRALRRVIIG